MQEFNLENKDIFLKNNKFVVITLSSPWCTACPVVERDLKDISKQYKDIVFLQVNIKNPKGMEVAREFKIMSVPSLLFFKEGHLVEIVRGAAPYNKLDEKIKEFYESL